MTAGQNTGPLAGKRVLIVEDEWLVAEAIEFAVEAAGGKVVGPFPTIAQALAVLTGYGTVPDAATLNIRLADGESYPIADQLEAMNIPFLFASANGASSLPRRFARKVLLDKPVLPSKIIEALTVITHA